MLLLTPEKKIRITHEKTNASSKASILSVGKKELNLLLTSHLNLCSGERVKLEIPQREDALYVIDAKVLEIWEGKLYTLCLGELSKPQRRQRRRAERIPTQLKVKFFILPDNKTRDTLKEGLLLDISKTGAFLVAKEPLPLKNQLIQIIEITFKKEGNIPMGIKGKLVRKQIPLSNSSGKWIYGYGIEFNRPFPLLAS